MSLAAGGTCRWDDRGVEILSSRILLRPVDLDRSRRFYRDVLGLAVYREFGPASDPGVVFFLGQGMLEVSGHGSVPAGGAVMIWLQVRDVRAEHSRLAAAGVRILREPAAESWGSHRPPRPPRPSGCSPRCRRPGARAPATTMAVQGLSQLG